MALLWRSLWFVQCSAQCFVHDADDDDNDGDDDADVDVDVDVDVDAEIDVVSPSLRLFPKTSVSLVYIHLFFLLAGWSNTRVGRVRHVLCELLSGHCDRDVLDLVLRPGAGAHRRALRRR